MKVDFIHKYGGAEFAAKMNMRNKHNQVLKLFIETEEGEFAHKLTVDEAIKLIGELEDALDDIKRAERYIKEAEGVNA
ncbi:hypothetical protein [Paenibacillus sp. NEAU-GSW1]|uniref:hypothetical protein n=1 Tax=Paenibacillus sp. NEAU-GSW1 TaxID=2682486 RepID=UPI0012E1C755|nr:hypothetical protein [Paenibacillus sp. NEAU-GSW1]MUT66052.1 hypothetical protein [Paenibacillus sp. NEAU-GSW1]